MASTIAISPTDAFLAGHRGYRLSPYPRPTSLKQCSDGGPAQPTRIRTPPPLYRSALSIRATQDREHDKFVEALNLSFSFRIESESYWSANDLIAEDPLLDE
jgi:hypothetical protein